MFEAFDASRMKKEQILFSAHEFGSFDPYNTKNHLCVARFEPKMSDIIGLNFKFAF